MHGNVWEWVEDCFHDGYHGAPENGTAWLDEDGGDCDSRVVRGGSWSYSQLFARSTGRRQTFDLNFSDSVFRRNDVGFRVLCLSKFAAR